MLLLLLRTKGNQGTLNEGNGKFVFCRLFANILTSSSTFQYNAKQAKQKKSSAVSTMASNLEKHRENHTEVITNDCI